MSDLDYDWLYLLDKCHDIFEEEPILEFAIATVFKTYNTKENLKSTPYYFFKKWAFPYWQIIKLKRHSKNNSDIIASSKDKNISYGVFNIVNTRDNNYGCIFPVMKKIDEKGKHSILVTYHNVYNEKKEEIDSLKNTHIVFEDDLSSHR